MKIKHYLCKQKENKRKSSNMEKSVFDTKKWNTKTDNPKLCVKVLADGRGSLYLLYNYGYSGTTGKTTRAKESLRLYLISNPRTPIERQHNKETLSLAQKIKEEKGQQLLEDKEGYRLKQSGINLYDYFANFIKTAKVADTRLLESALRNFQTFMADEYPQFANRIEAKNLSKDMMQKFAYYIEDNHKGEGIRTYWQRFKRLINYAVEQKVIKKSPCIGIKVRVTNDILGKDILSKEEIQTLFATHYDKENPIIRRAFALTCFTGIRYCDVKRLTYGDVDFSNKLLTFRQSKVAHDSGVSGVTIPLNNVLLSIIGEKPTGAKDSELIFALPSLEMCLKALKRWVKRAGISKHISWHCARHSFAVNILNNGANIKTVASLLGHSGLKHTEKYTRAIDSLKQEAINSLPELKI